MIKNLIQKNISVYGKSIHMVKNSENHIELSEKFAAHTVCTMRLLGTHACIQTYKNWGGYRHIVHDKAYIGHTLRWFFSFLNNSHNGWYVLTYQ